MLPGVRQNAGLGPSPTPYYTNAVESMNSLLKKHTENKKLDLCAFIEKLKTLIEVQFLEVKRAVAGLGDYKVCDAYPDFQYSTASWCLMNPVPMITQCRKKPSILD
jgi:hypothetical protein